MSELVTQRFPLAAFERYMLLDDQPDYSMTCHIRFWFEGQLDRRCFEQALTQALQRHPILTSKIEATRAFGLFAKQAFVPCPVTLVDILDWDDQFLAREAEVVGREDVRVRFLVRTDHEQSMLAVKFHHAVVDGIGVFQFMEDLLLLYDNYMTGKSRHRLPDLRPEKLSERISFGLSLSGWFKRLHLDLARLTRFFGKLPTPLAACLPYQPPRLAASPTAAERVVIPFSEASNTQDLAKAMGLTFNDLMVGRLLRTCLKWNRDKGGTVKSWRPFRMNVPVSLRTPNEDDMPAANFVSMVFLDRLPSAIDNEALLVRSVAEEMDQVKRDRMGLTLIMAVTWLMRLKIFGSILRSSMCMTTVGLTNLGQPFKTFKLCGKDGKVRSGNVTLLGLDTFPPVRRKTLATLSVNRYAGLLSMTLRYDSRSWSVPNAKEFLNRYMSTLMNQPQSLKSVSGLVAKHEVVNMGSDPSVKQSLKVNGY